MLTILRNRHRRGYTRGPLSLFTFWVPCCDVRYDFRIRTKFCSSLLPVVCRRTHVLLTLFVFASGFGWFSRCCCFISLHLVYPMLLVSLDCPFLIATSGLSKVYLIKVRVRLLFTAKCIRYCFMLLTCVWSVVFTM